jgi:hypothetical protein
MKRNILISAVILIIFSSCEDVIEIDLNDADPVFVVEAIIFKDSICTVHLTRTASYFSPDEPQVIDDAIINLSDGTLIENLNYAGNGYYTGNTIIGTEGTNYEIEIFHDGVRYKGTSFLPFETDIVGISYNKTESGSMFDPTLRTMFIIKIEFIDDPDQDNFYMVRYKLDGEVQQNSYYVLTEDKAVNGYLNMFDINNADKDTISFSEWMFCERGEVEVQVFSIDESIYNYFLQLNDILFWKRTIVPPTPYNPKSNISNGALGYFAAWTFDSSKIILE